jgi:hypothetical protein
MSHDPFASLTARLREFMLASSLPTCLPPAGDRYAALARELFATQFKAVPAYRALAVHQGRTPATVTDSRDIPAVPTAAFKEFEFTSLAPDRRERMFHSSGTTQHLPSRVFHDAASLALYATSAQIWFQRHLLPEAGEDAGARFRFVMLTPPAGQAPHSSLACMGDFVADRFGDGQTRWFGRLGPDGAWKLEADALRTELESNTAAQTPVCLFGTAFSFVHLLDHLAATGSTLRLPPGSRVMETGGYKGRSRTMPRTELHAQLTRRLGVPAAYIVGEYGMCELASQAYDGVAGGTAPRRFQFPPWARAVVVSPETGREVPEGEAGLLRVYDLANVRSVLAVQTEDLALRRSGGFELLGRASLAEARGCSLLAA